MPVFEPRSGPRYNPVAGGRDPNIVRYKLVGPMLREAKLKEAAFKTFNRRGGVMIEANKQALRLVIGYASANLSRSIRQNRRPQIKSQGNVSLGQVIKDDKSHKVTPEGFRFMVETQVRPVIDYAFSLEYGDRSQIGREIYFLFLGKTPVERLRGANRKSNPLPEDRFNQRANLGAGASRTFRFSYRPHSGRGNRFSPGRQGGVQSSRLPGAKNFVTDRILGPRELGRSDAPRLKSAQFQQSRFKVTIRNPVPQYAYGRKAGRKWAKEAEVAYPNLINKIYEEKYAALSKDVPLIPTSKAKTRKSRGANLKGKIVNGVRNGDVTVIPGPGQ